MKLVLMLISMAIQTTPSQPDIWQECKFEKAELCEPSGCKEIEPTLKVYMANYVNDDGQRGGYYYRCLTKGGCTIIEPYWVGFGRGGYRVWEAREKGVSSRLSPDGEVTDIVTLEDVVLISRGKCWKCAATNHYVPREVECQQRPLILEMHAFRTGSYDNVTSAESNPELSAAGGQSDEEGSLSSLRSGCTRRSGHHRACRRDFVGQPRRQHRGHPDPR